jgi:hypothetical protein
MLTTISLIGFSVQGSGFRGSKVQDLGPPWRDGMYLLNYFRILWNWVSITHLDISGLGQGFKVQRFKGSGVLKKVSILQP